ncbi:MAG: hypothetical protein ACJ796_22165 [Gemmatimonadaceae bacterium]
MTALQYRFSKRIFAAAVRLAAVYAACVIVTFAIVLSVSRNVDGLIHILPFLGIPGAICFAAAFVLLAFARRAGFIALWLILLGFWGTPMILTRDFFTEWDTALLFWSILAAPLYAMVMLGFPSADTATSAMRRWMPLVLGLVWLSLVIVNLRFQFRPLFDSYTMGRVYGLLSFILPLAVTTTAIRRICLMKAPAAR